MVNSHRLLVRGHRVPYHAKEVQRSTESIREQTIFPVWIVSCMYTDFPPSYISFRQSFKIRNRS